MSISEREQQMYSKGFQAGFQAGVAHQQQQQQQQQRQQQQQQQQLSNPAASQYYFATKPIVIPTMLPQAPPVPSFQTVQNSVRDVDQRRLHMMVPHAPSPLTPISTPTTSTPSAGIGENIATPTSPSGLAAARTTPGFAAYPGVVQKDVSDDTMSELENEVPPLASSSDEGDPSAVVVQKKGKVNAKQIRELWSVLVEEGEGKVLRLCWYNNRHSSALAEGGTVVVQYPFQGGTAQQKVAFLGVLQVIVNADLIESAPPYSRQVLRKATRKEIEAGAPAQMSRRRKAKAKRDKC